GRFCRRSPVAPDRRLVRLPQSGALCTAQGLAVGPDLPGGSVAGWRFEWPPNCVPFPRPTRHPPAATHARSDPPPATAAYVGGWSTHRRLLGLLGGGDSKSRASASPFPRAARALGPTAAGPGGAGSARARQSHPLCRTLG